MAAKSSKKPAAPKKPKLADWAKAQEQDESTQAKFYRNEIKKLNRLVQSRKTGSEAVLDAVREVYADNPLEIQVTGKMPSQGDPKKGGVEEAFTFWSDWQVGKITATFNPTVAAERVDLLLKKIVRITELRRTHTKISKISVCLGGDQVEGEDVFPNQSFTIAGSVLDQAVRWIPEMTARGLLTLAANFEQVDVDCVVGNHGRNGSKLAIHHPKTNWDRVSYEVTKLIVKGPNGDQHPNINFKISDDFWAVNEILGWRNLMVHGDTIPGGFNGAGRYALKMSRAHSMPEIDNMFYGHFHTFGVNTINDITYVCNGTLESDNDYALRSLAAAGYPCQMLSFFTEEHGMIACDPLYLMDKGLRVPRWKRARKSLGA